MTGPHSDDDRIVELEEDRFQDGIGADLDREAAAGVAADPDDRYLLEDRPPHWG